MKASPIINADELAKILKAPELIILHAGNNARNIYDTQHITNAYYLELNTDFSEVPEDYKNGGRHPLPAINDFIKIIQKLGITQDSYIVIYDDKNAANAAARLWWMLRAAGLEKVQVLNGGLQAAINYGVQTDTQAPLVPASGDYTFTDWQFPTVNIQEVEQATLQKDKLIIDVRETPRYNGETEPIDAIAGHIPNAQNAPFANNLAKDGTYKDPEELKQYFSELFSGYKPENIIIHCGSGVTACHTLLAIDYAGLNIPNLYVGSWSEWSRNNKLIATNE
ncbi:sulfurtransferase [Elizabethkingia meningoseptica]|uniref:Sulfurtransferase n=1 Tax=Elizabethkingia meningoseptica TaxID=238 RepID=A0A1V3TXA3_ELIME|nr:MULTISPECIES: sulfurtransferase [Elizabethkingia]AQX04592.1 sulfurtransferase [Elizabethkingia meningoseptica]AQX12055.1 sulfurtransferase [Elizabethkingia meningoseptica]AQX46636.1 sulfurtransferase [Elizabethkingia meningoseptica]EOR31399.1 Rhodanese domain protein [Elizabethkingia meningoseptica ATCC 13253 = NBRC 12535]KUY19150.1 sulfurtransferase [Elizabethkingia meningoseptica]